MAPLPYVLGRLKKKYALAPRAGATPGAFDPHPGYAPVLEDYNRRLPAMWQDVINQDPLLQGDLANILGEGIGDRSNVQGALRAALVKFGGADALRGIMGQLGSAGAGLEDLIDEVTIGGAGASDTSGTSIIARLEKANRDRMLAETDIRAAKGIQSSGQTGYEIGEARQAHTINRNEAVDQLLDFLRGGISAYAGREGQRNAARAQARAAAAARVADLGLEPPPPPTPPAASPAMQAQLRRNARRPARRPLRSEDTGW